MNQNLAPMENCVYNTGGSIIPLFRRTELVRSRRLELPRGFPHKHLKLARLPFRHDRTGSSEAGV